MDISAITITPKLIEVKLDDKETIADFSEAIVFYTPDRQPLDLFLKLSNAMANDQMASIDLLEKLILDKDGKQVIVDGKIPPVKVIVKAMAKVMELLGK